MYEQTAAVLAARGSGVQAGEDGEPLRAAGYGRVSSKRQAEEGLSKDEQERRLHEYIAAQGWESLGVYIDAAVTGKTRSRPALDKMLAQLNRIDRVVVPRLDRLGRSTRHLLELAEVFDRHGIALVSLKENLDTSTPVGRLTRSLLASIAEFESDQLGDRVADVAEARVRDGGKHHGRAPYGYRANGGALVVVQGEAVVIARIFREYIAGRSQQAITRGLDAAAIKPRQAAEWHQSSVSGILRNVGYTGRVRINGSEYDGEHEAIIDLETWNAAERIRQSQPGRAGRRTSGRHLFTKGMLRCGICDGPMTTRTERRSSVLYEAYYCARKRKHGCSMPTQPRAVIDGAAYEWFLHTGFDLEATRVQLTDFLNRRLADVAHHREQAERDAAQANARLEHVRRDYADGKLDADDWRDFKEQLGGEAQSAEAQLDLMHVQERRIAEEEPLRDVETTTLRRLAEIEKAVAGFDSADAVVEDVDRVRAALAQLVAAFSCVPEPETIGQWRNPQRGGWLLVPHVLPEVLEGFDLLEPVLQRVPLDVTEPPGRNDQNTLTM